MCNFTLFMSAPFFYTAVFEFQIVRVWFVLNPYQVLTHDELSWPLAVSVPLFTDIEIFGVWHTERTCDFQISKGLLYKLNIDIELEYLNAIPLDLKMILVALLLVPELFLQINKRKSFLNSFSRQNIIVPETLQHQCEQQQLKAKVHLGMLSFIITILGIWTVSSPSVYCSRSVGLGLPCSAFLLGGSYSRN